MNLFNRFKWLIGRGIHLGGYCCADTEELLFEYVEGELTEPTRHKLDKHLADCPACVAYLESYRTTIQLTHDHARPTTQMPPELRDRLRQFIEQNPDLR